MRQRVSLPQDRIPHHSKRGSRELSAISCSGYCRRLLSVQKPFLFNSRTSWIAHSSVSILQVMIPSSPCLLAKSVVLLISFGQSRGVERIIIAGLGKSRQRAIVSLLPTREVVARTMGTGATHGREQGSGYGPEKIWRCFASRIARSRKWSSCYCPQFLINRSNHSDALSFIKLLTLVIDFSLIYIYRRYPLLTHAYSHQLISMFIVPL